MDTILRRLGLSGKSGVLRTRQGTLLVAGVAALASLMVLLVFLHNYRKDNTSTVPVTVLLADRVIPKGTAGSIVASDTLYKPTSVAQSEVKAGALTDASALAGKVATVDIYPGQQITASDFAEGGDTVRGKLSGSQRAIAVPVDAAHGLIGQVRAGDHVDVLAGFNATNAAGAGRPVVRTLIRDVLVLEAPGTASNGSSTSNNNNGQLIVRVSDDAAAALAFASDNGKVWFVLRPPAGATNSSQSAPVDLSALLGDIKTIQAGGR